MEGEEGVWEKGVGEKGVIEDGMGEKGGGGFSRAFKTGFWLGFPDFKLDPRFLYRSSLLRVFF